ncbi:hypothetical protein NPX13_g5277 [Xylaria arbuscula]|uniref:Shugoshin C-terminal domain-containing protein n=1 Tax=Xylaria arbuscula TaxID=114810 RepID=A0A9W8NEX0_9PEZI|nr:hypothetical protein NPX13_g5277 [Xylaria arbuscula]
MYVISFASSASSASQYALVLTGPGVTVRRKFLRQNRDIARINSTQSLKIRSLENECARLLSENLQLRSEVLQLKTELQGSHAHRVAEHALQIKEKMEAQLVEWGAMLAGLGHEPVPRNRSPRALKKPRLERTSIGRTRVRDEILALCSEAEESTDSLDIGPPPVSRFVDEDPVKLDLSTLSTLLNPALSESEASDQGNTCQDISSPPTSPLASTKTTDIIAEIPKVEAATNNTAPPEQDGMSHSSKANLKRKSREDDEKENVPLSKPLLVGVVAKHQLGKMANEKPKPTNRPIKELPTTRKDARDKPPHAQRKPLSAKSSNEALRSPKKSALGQAESKKTKPKGEEKGDESNKRHIKLPKEPTPIEVPPPSVPDAPPTVDIEPESLSAEPNVPIPDSPESCAVREDMNETPPPVDISSKGETTRANRRARAAVSYAEPNLRDKMRRPNTKQLFDAVTSDSKSVRRTSQVQREEPPAASSSVAKSGAKSGSSRKDGALQRDSHDACGDADVMMASPLAQKISRTPALELPATVTTDRKKKDAAGTSQAHKNDGAPGSPVSRGANRRLEELAAREAEVATMFNESDVYEFTESSPNDIIKEPALEDKSKKAKSSRQSRSRRLSSIARDDLQFGNADPSEKTVGRSTSSRKRASMAAVRSSRSDLENLRGESPSVDGDSVSTVDSEGTTREKPTSNRRRTTMI